MPHQSSIALPQMNMPWFDSPFFDKLLAQSTLDQKTKKLVQDFAEQGYLIIDPEIEDFHKLADDIINNFKYEHKGRVKDAWFFKDRIQDAWTFNESAKKIAIPPRIMSILRILYQREPIPFQTLNFPKGTQQTTHSDAIHFHSVPHGFMAGVWVALEDIDLYNGPVHYYPGSQKLPYVDLNDLGMIATTQKKSYEYYPIYEQFLRDLIEAKGLKKFDLQIKKGQALIWSANLLHGGSPILDPQRTRYSQVTHFYFADCMYYIPMLSDPFIKKLHLKRIRNVVTGEFVPHFYNGQKIPAYYFDEIEDQNVSYRVENLRIELEQSKAKIYALQSLEAKQKNWQEQQEQALQNRMELKLLQSQVQILEAELERVRSQLYHAETELTLVQPQLTLVQKELNKIRPQWFEAATQLTLAKN